MKTLLKPLSFIPALLLMYMIFSFSGQAGETSSDLSFRVSCKIVSVGNDVLGTNLSEDRIEHYAERIEGFIRKLAHVSEYFALAIAVAFPLYVYGVRGLLLMLIAGGFCVAFACGDEFHQSFVNGRNPSKRDVLIDSIGIFFGIIVVRMVGWTGRMTIFRSKENPVSTQPSWDTSTAYQQPKQQKNISAPYQQPQQPWGTPTSQPQPQQPWNPSALHQQPQQPWNPSVPYQQPYGNPPPQQVYTNPAQQKAQESSSQPHRQPFYQQSSGVPPYVPYQNQGMYQNPYVANFDEENFDNDYEEEYDEENDSDNGKPFRLFHYEDEYEEDETDEEDSPSPKLHSFSFKKHNS